MAATRKVLHGERLLVHKDGVLVGEIVVRRRKHRTLVDLTEHDGGKIYHESRKRLTSRPKSE